MSDVNEMDTLYAVVDEDGDVFTADYDAIPLEIFHLQETATERISIYPNVHVVPVRVISEDEYERLSRLEVPHTLIACVGCGGGIQPKYSIRGLCIECARKRIDELEVNNA